MKIKSLSLNILICIIIFSIAYWINKFSYIYNDLFFKYDLLITIKSIDSLIFTVWQVQAIFSSLTLLVLTILQTQFEKRIYGMRFLEALDMKYFFSHCVISCIVLNSISYYFVAKEMLSGLLFIFSIITLLILYMLHNSFKLAMYPENLNDYIAKNIIKTLQKEIKIENNKKNESNKNNR